MEATPRTMNWNRLNFYSKTKAPVHLERSARKAEIVKRRLRRLREGKPIFVLVCGRKWGKTAALREWICSEEYTLIELKFALAINNRRAIKKVIDKRINIRGKYDGQTSKNSTTHLRV